MPTQLAVSLADLALEAGYPQPDFGLLRDGSSLVGHLYTRLEPYGLTLNDIRAEGVTGSAADRHILVTLFNGTLSLRVRIDKVEVAWTRFNNDQTEKLKSATLDAMKAFVDYKATISFKSFAVALALHGPLNGMRAREYLARFVTNIPTNVGPPVGAGAAFYFGAADTRLYSAVIVDASVIVTDGLFVRVHSTWDARQMALDALGGIAEAYFRQVWASLDLQVA